MKNKTTILCSACLGAVLSLGGCSHPNSTKVSEQNDKDVSHNIFTGSKTVTDTKTTKYRDNRTGETNTAEAKVKTKYDSNGNKISESKDYDSGK